MGKVPACGFAEQGLGRCYCTLYFGRLPPHAGFQVEVPGTPQLSREAEFVLGEVRQQKQDRRQAMYQIQNPLVQSLKCSQGVTHLDFRFWQLISILSNLPTEGEIGWATFLTK